MTTIIAKENANSVEIGFDSQATGWDKFDLDQPKVFVNNGVIFGVAGRLLISTELKHATIPTPPPGLDGLDEWVTHRLNPKVRQLLNEVAPRRGYDGFEMQVLVIVNGRVYSINGDTGWSRRKDGLYAIGSGSTYAFATVAAGGSIAKGLQLAAQYDPYTGGRLTVTTDNNLLAQNPTKG